MRFYFPREVWLRASVPQRIERKNLDVRVVLLSHLRSYLLWVKNARNKTIRHFEFLNVQQNLTDYRYYFTVSVNFPRRLGLIPTHRHCLFYVEHLRDVLFVL